MLCTVTEFGEITVLVGSNHIGLTQKLLLTRNYCMSTDNKGVRSGELTLTNFLKTIILKSARQNVFQKLHCLAPAQQNCLATAQQKRDFSADVALDEEWQISDGFSII